MYADVGLRISVISHLLVKGTVRRFMVAGDWQDGAFLLDFVFCLEMSVI